MMEVLFGGVLPVYHPKRYVHQLKNIYQVAVAKNEHSVAESLSTV